MRAAFVALLLFAHAAWVADIDPSLLAATRQEGSVVWYTGLIVNQGARPPLPNNSR